MTHTASYPLDPIHKEIDEADRQVIQILARHFDAVKRVGTVKREEDAPLLDTERERRVQASWIQDAEALGRSASFARRVLKEILNHSRRIQEGLRYQRDADQQFDLPSVAEVLTIEQYGYPRTYNLNDGMGPDIAFQCPVSEMLVTHLPLDLTRVGS